MRGNAFAIYGRLVGYTAEGWVHCVWWRLGPPLRVSVLLDLDVTQHHRGWRGTESVWTKLCNFVDKLSSPSSCSRECDASLWALACPPVQWRWEQKDQGLKVVLNYTVSLKLTWTTLDPVSENKQTDKQKNKTICSKGCWRCSSEVGRAEGPGLSPKNHKTKK